MSWLPQRLLAVARPRRTRGVIDDVVVDQGGGVNHLDDAAVAHVAVAVVAEHPADEEQDGRADPLAATLEYVGAGLADRGRAGVELVGDEPLDQCQPRAHGIEGLEQAGLDAACEWCVRAFSAEPSCRPGRQPPW